MRAATIRRSLVFAVCAVGVGALYLTPGLARTPGQLDAGRPADEPLSPTTSRPSTPASSTPTDEASPAGSGRRSATQPGSGSGARTGSDPTTRPAAEPSRSSHDDDQVPGQGGAQVDGQDGGQDGGDSTDRSERRTGGSRAPSSSPRPATAYAPSDADREPPQPVRQITTGAVTAKRLSLSWPAARDNDRVIGYHIWLNGFEVASTAETHATVRWFNDDTPTHVVQVKAVDAAGNESASSPTVLVTRPDPEPEPSPEPSTPAPEPEPEPTPEPSGADTKPAGALAVDPTSEPDPSESDTSEPDTSDQDPGSSSPKRTN